MEETAKISLRAKNQVFWPYLEGSAGIPRTEQGKISLCLISIVHELTFPLSTAEIRDLSGVVGALSRGEKTSLRSFSTDFPPFTLWNSCPVPPGKLGLLADNVFALAVQTSH